jgi:hypothetical protein
MYTYLKQHPDIYLPVYKEPHFFCRDLSQSAINITDEEIYRSLFDGAGEHKLTGEASVWYLMSKIAAERIKAFNPRAKIIIMLRDPVQMIYSLHGLYVRTGNEDIPDFEKALEIEPERRKWRSLPGTCYFPEGLFYTEVAMYYDKVKRFMDVFGGENVHLVLFDEFTAHTPRSYRGVLEFLGVDADFQAEFDLEKASAVIRPLVFAQLRRTHPEVKRKLSMKVGKGEHASPLRPPLSPRLTARLRELFSEDIQKTARLIHRDLSHWLNA